MAGLMSTANKLFMLVDIDVTGDEKLDMVRKKMGLAGDKAQQAGQQFGGLIGQTKDAGDAADKTGGQFGKMFGIGMNILFLGMALNMVFGRMAKNMLKMTGASSALSAGLKSVLLPFFLAITPAVLKLSQAMMDLPRSVKMVIGGIVGLLAVIGPLMMMLGQVALIAISGISLGMIGTAAGVAAGGIAILVAGLRIGMEIGRRFGGTIRKAMSMVGKSVQHAIRGATNILKAFEQVIGGLGAFIKGVVTGDIDQAINGIVQIFKGLINTVKGVFQTLFAFILGGFEEFAPKLFYKGRAFILNLIDGIKSVADRIGTAISNAFPSWLIDIAKAGVLGPGGLALNAANTATDFLTPNDFILSGGKMIQPDKRDTIVGMKPGGALDTGSGGKTVEVNINDPVMKEDVDVQSVVDEVEDRVDRNTRGRSGGLT